MRKSTRNLTIGTLAAAVAGYAAGVLTAPKSGKETRKDISKAASNAKTQAEKKLKQLHSELDELIKSSKNQSQKLGAKAKQELDKALHVATLAKQKAREMLSGFHNGEADDKDLQKAIDEATQAITHLKKYIAKK